MHLRLGAAALCVVVVQRLVFLLVAKALGTPWRLFFYDGPWYERVARDGYRWPGIPTPHGRTLSDLAFFPLYPLSARAVHAMGVPWHASLFAMSWLGLVMAAWGIAALGTTVGGFSTGLWLAALWGAAPRGFVTLLPYSEGPFTALAAWCLVAVARRRWWTAALLCAAAGLTRAAALGLLVALMAAWLRDRRRPPGPDAERPPSWGVPVVAASGLGGYLAFVAVRTGHLDGYVRVQQAWNMSMGWPWQVLGQIGPAWQHPFRWGSFGWIVIVLAVSLLLALALVTVASVRARCRLELGAYAWFMLLWTCAARGYFWSKARFLLPAFTLGLAPALWLSRRRWWVGAVIVVALSLLTDVIDARVWADVLSP